MIQRTYGRYCGLARALELVGEHWMLLVIRDLLVGPKRFTDLRRGLLRIPTSVLSARLKDLEQAGIVRRRILPRPSGAIVYELTAYGSALEEIVLRLGRWGAQSLGEAGAEEIVTVDSLIMVLRSTFRTTLVGEVSPAEAVANGSVRLAGAPELLARFVEVFHIPPRPSPRPA